MKQECQQPNQTKSILKTLQKMYVEINMNIQLMQFCEFDPQFSHIIKEKKARKSFICQ